MKTFSSQLFSKRAKGIFYSSGYYNWSLDCEGLHCSCLAMFNFNLCRNWGISIFEQIMLVCLKSNKPGPNIAPPTSNRPHLLLKGFSANTPQFQATAVSNTIWPSLHLEQQKMMRCFWKSENKNIKMCAWLSKKTSKYLRPLSSFDMKMIRKSIIRIPNGSIIHNEGRNPLWR